MKRKFPNRLDYFVFGSVALSLFLLCLSLIFPFYGVVGGRGPNGGEVYGRTWYLDYKKGGVRLNGPGVAWELDYVKPLAIAGLYILLRSGALAALSLKVPPPGICEVCGYDLRATPDRCPECGALPRK